MDSAIPFSPQEAAVTTAATEAFQERAYVKTTLDEGIQAASEWGTEQSKPWYQRTVTWKWVIGIASAAGAGTYLYFKVYKPWKSGKLRSGKRGA